MLPFIEPAELPADAIEVGCILDAWGIKGWFKVLPFSGDPQALFSSKRWYILPPLKGSKTVLVPSLLKIQEAKNHSDFVVAKVQDCSDRNGAETLKGARIFVSRMSFPTPGVDEFYWVDLVGLKVQNREGLDLGVVKEIMSSGPQSVLVITPSEDYKASAISKTKESANEADLTHAFTPSQNSRTSKSSAKASAPAVTPDCLIPFVSQFIDDVDLKAGLIKVDWQVDY
jgi:16S rRNA processing protein RimM